MALGVKPVVIIPARYASTRLPGKLLLDVAGKPLVQRVYERAQLAGSSRIVVATDDTRIYDTVRGFGGEVCMTAIEHQSGTDRIAEAITILRIAAQDIVVNLQGDEPLMPASLISNVAQTLADHPDVAMATACHAIHDYDTLHNPNVCKVVCDQRGYALYFSRAPIPWPRDHKDQPIKAWRHIGLYAYRAEFIKRYATWAQSPLEQIEVLEQLRVLAHGEDIAVYETQELPGPGVDTQADLEQVRRYFTENEANKK